MSRVPRWSRRPTFGHAWSRRCNSIGAEFGTEFATRFGTKFGTKFGTGFGTDPKRQAYWDLIDCLDMFEDGESPDVSGIDALHALGAPQVTTALLNDRYDEYVTDAVHHWQAAS
jgi:hypothetical protein